VAAADDAGVPVIAPVDELIESPDGSEGEIEKEIGDVPPLEVTGMKLAADAAVRVSDAMARVVVRAVEIASTKVLVLVAPLESVAVTV
jgi:hypothetical protein